jgi:hypothetical protein
MQHDGADSDGYSSGSSEYTRKFVSRRLFLIYGHCVVESNPNQRGQLEWSRPAFAGSEWE